MKGSSVNDLDATTRLALIEKAENFMINYKPSYWGSKKPPEQRKFLYACDIIQEMGGLIIRLLEEDDALCEPPQ